MSRRLIILDDDESIGTMLAMIAEGAGFEAVSTTSPEEFFELLAHKCPSHIALDLVMPGMDGVQVMADLAARRCQSAIVITSGVGNRVLDAACRSARERGLNVIGALSKPFGPAAFRDMLCMDEPAEGGKSDAMPGQPAPRSRTAAEVDALDLQQAIDEDEIFLVFQPQVNCSSGAIMGFEALARWNHPRLGVLMPDRFIPLAEQAHLIGALTGRVVDLGLAELAKWSKTGSDGDAGEQAKTRNEVTLSINVSASSIEDQYFVHGLLRACIRHQIDPQRIVLELTESMSMRDPVGTLEQLTRMRMKGFQLSIDDFGTGFSSMLQLARLPFSEIKIDKSFVMSAMNSVESRAVVRSIIRLGKSFGLRTVAEGVETAAMLEYLRSRGCDVAQGYYIARPLPAEDVGQWWESRRVPQQAPTASQSHGTHRGAFRPFVWDRDFDTGFAEIDQQHRHLVGLINQFQQASAEDREMPAAELATLFSRLVDYARQHFAAEEARMEAVGLDPAFIEFHRGEHACFITEVLDLRESTDATQPDSLVYLSSFLVHWLTYHILGVDQSMARQINAIRDGANPMEAAERERLGTSGGRDPMVDALVSLVGLLMERNRKSMGAMHTLDERLRAQDEGRN